MKFKILFLALCFNAVLFSCGSSNNEESEALNYSLTPIADKVFQLDDETAFDRIAPKISVLNDVTYYHFFNHNNHSIYFYKYETGELSHKIKLDKEGPNAVENPYYFLDYWVSDLDNIFINTMQFYYHLDGEGKILKRIKAHDSFSFSQHELSFNPSTTYKDGKLYTSYVIRVPSEEDTSWLRCIYDFEKEEIEEVYLDERSIFPFYEEKAERIREMSKSGGISTMTFYFAGDYDYLYVSSQISDSLYYFEGETFKGKYFAGNPAIPSTDLDGYFSLSKITKLEGGGISIGPNPKQPPVFKSMLSSTDNRYIYRVFSHGSKIKIDPETNEEVPDLIGASLIVFDTKTKKSGLAPISIEDLNYSRVTYDIFVVGNKAHFPIAEPDSENEKVYKSFEITQK